MEHRYLLYYIYRHRFIYTIHIKGLQSSSTLCHFCSFSAVRLSSAFDSASRSATGASCWLVTFAVQVPSWLRCQYKEWSLSLCYYYHITNHNNSNNSEKILIPTYLPLPTYLQTYFIRSYHINALWFGEPPKHRNQRDPWQSGSARQDVFLPSSLQVAAAHHGSRARGGALAWEPRGAMGKTMGNDGKTWEKHGKNMGKLWKHMMMIRFSWPHSWWRWVKMMIHWNQFLGSIFLTKPHSVLLAATGS